MSQTQNYHQQLKDALAARNFEQAQALWLELAEQFPDQTEFLLLLIKDFLDAGQSPMAAELASLIALNLQAAGKHHEWLYTLKLQASVAPMDKNLRAQLLEAYRQIYENDSRLNTILTVAELDKNRSPLPAAIAKADTLLALQVGSFCQHKSWGLGRVKSFDTTLARIVVAFPHNPDHAMQLPYAAESLQPLNADHIEIRKTTDLDNLKQLAATDPVALVRVVVLSYNRAVMTDRIEATLSGSVVPADQWKKWWDNAKKLLKRDPHFELPVKKNDPLRLRTAPVSQQDELVEAFRTAVSLSQKTTASRQLLKIVDEIESPDLLLQEFQDGLVEAIKKTNPTRRTERLEAALVLEEICSHQQTPAETTSPLVAELLADAGNLPSLLEDLSTAAQRRAIAALKAAHPDRLLHQVNRLPSKTLDDIADLLPQAATQIAHHVQNQTASLELLYWLCKSITAPNAPAWLDTIPRTTILAAVLNTLEAATTRSETKRFRDLLLGDETLLIELLAHASADKIRDFARQILTTTVFEELDRRLLMSRVVKEFPFVQDLLVTRTAKEQPPIVSRASFQKRQAELDEIIQKKIPQNSKEIGQARSYGDLRENFEFKAAKDMQKLLMRRRAELEVLLTRAQPTDFTDVKTDIAQIGTSVTVTDLDSSKQSTYHILGAWDSNPDRGIISYPAALAQALLNKRVGETVESPGDKERQKLRIERIEKVPTQILQSL